MCIRDRHYKYQQPVANLSVDIGHKLTYNTGWNYYQYGDCLLYTSRCV